MQRFSDSFVSPIYGIISMRRQVFTNLQLFDPQTMLVQLKGNSLNFIKISHQQNMCKVKALLGFALEYHSLFNHTKWSFV